MAPNLSSSSEESTTDEEKGSSEEAPQVSRPRKPVSQKLDSHAESESESESEDDSDADTENAAMVQNVKQMEDSLEKTAAGNRGGETEKESTDVKGRKENTDDLTSKSESEDDSVSDSDSAAAIVKPMEVSPAKSKAGPSTQLTSVGKRGGETEEESNGAKRLKEGGSVENTDALLKMVSERSNTEPVNLKAKSSNADSSKLAAGLESGLGDRVEIEKQDKGKSWFSLDWALGKESIAKFAATKGLDHMKESKRIELKRRWRELHIAAIKLIVEQGELLQDQTKSLLDDSEP